MKFISYLFLLIIICISSVAMPQHNPRCQKPLPTLKKILEELKELSKQVPQKNYAVGGLFIKDENSQLIEAYRNLVTYKDTKLRSVMDIDFYTRFKQHNCDKVLCAVQILFGDELGPVYLYYAALYGINLSSLGYDRLKSPEPKYDLEFKAWYTVRPWKSVEEMVPMLKAVRNLPPKTLLLPNTRMLHSGIENPMKNSILANGLITFYLPFDQLAPEEKEKITYHELGHAVGTLDHLDISDEWLEASGWQVQGQQVINLRPEEFLSDYAIYKSDCFEDFAETFMYYRYHPEVLLKKSPRRYEYMKKYVYKGEEYLSDSACSLDKLKN